MKFIYVIILFLVFFNLASILVAGLGIIPYEYTIMGDLYTEDASGETVFANLSNVSFENAADMMLGNASVIALIVGGGVLAWITHSPAPLALALFLGVFITTFKRSITIFSGMGINNVMWVMGLAGMAFLIVITMIEYFTHGDV